MRSLPLLAQACNLIVIDQAAQATVVMPQLGVSVSEGTVLRWLVNEGERVEADMPIVEISTDKIDTEVPAPASGVLETILVSEGTTVAVGVELAVIAGTAREEEAVHENGADVAPPAAADAETAGGESVTNGSARRFISPVARRLAAEHGVDVRAIAGTGRGGRVTKKDILAFVEQGASSAVLTVPEQVPEAQPVPPEATRDSAAWEPLAGAEQDVHLAPLSPMRRSIAEHVRRSVDTSVHVTSAVDIDLTNVARTRARLKDEYERAHGVRLTYLAFIAQATTTALLNFPWINGEIRKDDVVTRDFVNLGCAVEVDDGTGLIVPVVRRAERLNLLGMAHAIAALAERARSGRLTHADVEGGTFTITNPGGYGIVNGIPVINQPQVAILGTYAAVKRPIVVEDADGNESIAVRLMMTISLTYDHRLIDGALAGRFLGALRGRLEAPAGELV